MQNQAEMFAAFMAFQAAQGEAKLTPVRKSKADKPQRAPLPTATPREPAPVAELPESYKVRTAYAEAATRNGMACKAYVMFMNRQYGVDWYAIARLTSAQRKALTGNEAARVADIIAERKALKAAYESAGNAKEGADMPWSRARTLAKKMAGDTGGTHDRQTPKAKACGALQRAFLIVHKAIDPERPDRQLVAAMEAMETVLRAVKINPEKLIGDAGQ